MGSPTVAGCHGELQVMYLCLDAVQTSEPQDLASPQLHLGVVDLIGVLRQLLLVDLLLRYAVAGLLQERQVLSRDARDQLTRKQKCSRLLSEVIILINRPQFGRSDQCYCQY